MLSGRNVRWPRFMLFLVSYGEYADGTDRQTDRRQTPLHYAFRWRGQRNNYIRHQFSWLKSKVTVFASVVSNKKLSCRKQTERGALSQSISYQLLHKYIREIAFWKACNRRYLIGLDCISIYFLLVVCRSVLYNYRDITTWELRLPVSYKNWRPCSAERLNRA